MNFFFLFTSNRKKECETHRLHNCLYRFASFRLIVHRTWNFLYTETILQSETVLKIVEGFINGVFIGEDFRLNIKY